MSSDKLHHINSLAELQSLFATNTYVAIDFYADWCGPCKAIAPHYESLAKQHSAPGVLAFAKVNVDRAQDAAQAHGISAMPTFMFFKEGRQVAVNGQPMIRGADPRALSAAAEKLGGLAKKRVAAA
ncbi:thioredoxin domain-containing protein [Biscogniauxia marginata]|nr:thioredoxin domain-containing protein [Biscogniauxia marginata]